MQAEILQIKNEMIHRHLVGFFLGFINYPWWHFYCFCWLSVRSSVFFLVINLNRFLSFRVALRKKCLYSELFWSIFSRIRTRYGYPQSKYGQEKLRNYGPEKLRIWTLFTQCKTFAGNGLQKFLLFLLSLNVL